MSRLWTRNSFETRWMDKKENNQKVKKCPLVRPLYSIHPLKPRDHAAPLYRLLLPWPRGPAASSYLRAASSSLLTVPEAQATLLVRCLDFGHAIFCVAVPNSRPRTWGPGRGAGAAIIKAPPGQIKAVARGEARASVAEQLPQICNSFETRWMASKTT